MNRSTSEDERFFWGLTFSGVAVILIVDESIPFLLVSPLLSSLIALSEAVAAWASEGRLQHGRLRATTLVFFCPEMGPFFALK